MLKGAQRVGCADRAFHFLLPVGFLFYWSPWSESLLTCSFTSSRSFMAHKSVRTTPNSFTQNRYPARRPLPFFDPYSLLISATNLLSQLMATHKVASTHTHKHTRLSPAGILLCTHVCVFQGYTPSPSRWFLLWQNLKLKRKSLWHCHSRNWFFMARCWPYERFNHEPKDVRVRD